MNDRLFAYGTLMAPAVLRRVIRRDLAGAPAELRGYARYQVRGASYPGLAPESAGCTKGVVYRDVDAEALGRLDRFEGELYDRLAVPVRVDATELDCWVYVIRPEHLDALSDSPWDAEGFLASGVAGFLERVRRGTEP